ncbi:hypothetical protein A11Q_1461 [Pseudobdellovibrio exovorus JSS]|uniref:Glycosyltransferase RgtA/B/C/D-like domain-containing protein n=2 Tax=Pseudobdellovibrio exovorus TaxID=453816 RepID=M4V8F5_9BACT|nr:hypothetical protein A11Q_1461 [Pseudobdellovibrio exovorus JSS]
MVRNLQKYNIKWLWIFGAPYIWALSVGLLLQFYIYPVWFSGTYWGHGLTQGDWVYFHEMAIQFAETAKVTGFNFKLVPLELSPVYLLGTAYYITDIYEPWVLLPFNALVHALSCVCLIIILQRLKFSSLSACVAILVFFAVPTASVLYSQVHRDGLVFLSFYLFVVFILDQFLKEKKRFTSYLTLFLSIVLVLIFRTYLLNFYSICIVGLALYLAVHLKTKEALKRSVCLLLISLVLLFVGQKIGHIGALHQSRGVPAGTVLPSRAVAHQQEETEFCQPENSFDRFFPEIVRRQLCNIQIIRLRSVANFPESRDKAYYEMQAYTDLRVDTPSYALGNIPILLRLAYVEPIVFLSKKENWTMFHYFSILETGLNLLFLSIALFYMITRSKWPILVPLLIASFFLLVLAASTVNMATFYRLRFGYISLGGVIGCAACVSLMQEFFIKRQKIE